MEMDKGFFNALVTKPKKSKLKSSSHTHSKQTLNAKDFHIHTAPNTHETFSYPWPESTQNMYDSQVSSNVEDPHQKIRLLNQSLQEQSNTANELHPKAKKIQDSLLGVAKTYSDMWQMDSAILKASQQALKTGVATSFHVNIQLADLETDQYISAITQPSSTSIQEPNDSLNGIGLKLEAS